MDRNTKENKTQYGYLFSCRFKTYFGYLVRLLDTLPPNGGYTSIMVNVAETMRHMHSTKLDRNAVCDESRLHSVGEAWPKPLDVNHVWRGNSISFI